MPDSQDTQIHLSCQHFRCDSFRFDKQKRRLILPFSSTRQTSTVKCPQCKGRMHVYDHGGLAAISALFGQVGVDCPEELLAAWSQQAMADGKQVGDLQALMERIVRRRNEQRIGMLLQTSRLPQVARKTFANYDLGRLSGENGKMVEHLQSLDFIPLGENVVIVGDPGTGKTHLAQAIGNACCDRLVPARYYKLPELVDKLRRSMDRETEGQTILHLVSVPCLIIDEVGYCGKLGDVSDRVKVGQMISKKCTT